MSNRSRAMIWHAIGVACFTSRRIHIASVQVRRDCWVRFDDVISDGPDLLNRFACTRFIRCQWNAATCPRIEVRLLWVAQCHVGSIFLRPNLSVNPLPVGWTRISPPWPDAQREPNSGLFFGDVEESVVDRVRVTILANEAKNTLFCMITAATSQVIDVFANFKCVGVHPGQFYFCAGSGRITAYPEVTLQ